MHRLIEIPRPTPSVRPVFTIEDDQEPTMMQARVVRVSEHKKVMITKTRQPAEMPMVSCGEYTYRMEQMKVGAIDWRCVIPYCKGRLRTDEKRGNPVFYGIHDHAFGTHERLDIIPNIIRNARSMLHRKLTQERQKSPEKIYAEVTDYVVREDPQALLYWPPLTDLLAADIRGENGCRPRTTVQKASSNARSQLPSTVSATTSAAVMSIISKKYDLKKAAEPQKSPVKTSSSLLANEVMDDDDEKVTITYNERHQPMASFVGFNYRVDAKKEGIIRWRCKTAGCTGKLRTTDEFEDALTYGDHNENCILRKMIRTRSVQPIPEVPEIFFESPNLQPQASYPISFYPASADASIGRKSPESTATADWRKNLGAIPAEELISGKTSFFDDIGTLNERKVVKRHASTEGQTVEVRMCSANQPIACHRGYTYCILEQDTPLEFILWKCKIFGCSGRLRTDPNYEKPHVIKGHSIGCSCDRTHLLVKYPNSVVVHMKKRLQQMAICNGYQYKIGNQTTMMIIWHCKTLGCRGRLRTDTHFGHPIIVQSHSGNCVVSTEMGYGQVIPKLISSGAMGEKEEKSIAITGDVNSMDIFEVPHSSNGIVCHAGERNPGIPHNIRVHTLVASPSKRLMPVDEHELPEEMPRIDLEPMPTVEFEHPRKTRSGDAVAISTSASGRPVASCAGQTYSLKETKMGSVLWKCWNPMCSASLETDHGGQFPVLTGEHTEKCTVEIDDHGGQEDATGQSQENDCQSDEPTPLVIDLEEPNDEDGIAAKRPRIE